MLTWLGPSGQPNSLEEHWNDPSVARERIRRVSISAEGAELGELLGMAEGAPLGAALGAKLGAAEGLKEGAKLGASE